MAIKKSTVSEYRKRVCAAMNYIDANIDRNPTLEEIAREATFSPFHFHRIFKAVVGETVSEFTRRLRLEKAACRLCSKADVDITKLALDYGFSSSQNFAKAFRKHFDMSPSEYHNSKIGNKDSNNENALSLSACYNTSVFDDSLISERTNTMNAEVMTLPDYNVAYVRKLGAYTKEVCGQAIEEIIDWAGPRGYLINGQIMGIYWDDPDVTPPERCRTDACVTIPDGTPSDDKAGINIQTITGGEYAVCHIEMLPDNFQGVWKDAFEWLVTNGYECADRPCFEIYHNDPKTHPEGKCIFDICIPLK